MPNSSEIKLEEWSTDPITKSMLGIGAEEAPPFTVNNNPEPPKIDVFNLDQYDDAVLRQIQLDLRIKRSRVRSEIAGLEKIILRLQKEYNNQVKRNRFYGEMIGYIEAYFQEGKSCNQPSPNTPPSQS